jgi:antitoxin component YwqK of YwqJK toxin-antitoxin module
MNVTLDGKTETGKTIDGKRVGPWIICFGDEVRGSKGEGWFDENNEKVGLWTETYYGSDKRVVSTYIAGTPVGIRLVWKQSTNVLIREEHRDEKGILDGPYREWWPNNGILSVEGHYKEKLRHGKWKTWYESGIKASECTYDMAIRVGVEWLWYKDGQLRIENFYVRNPHNRHSEMLKGVIKQWYPTGELLSEEHYQEGVRHGCCMTWYRNGLGETTCWYEMDVLHGPYISNYESGRVHARGRYDNDEPVGEWKLYFDKSPLTGVELNLEKDGDRTRFYAYTGGAPIPPIVFEVPVIELVKRSTSHPCIVFKEAPASGTLYLLCQFSEEHVHDYNFMVTFSKTTDIERMRCLYCQTLIREIIYKQP